MGFGSLIPRLGIYAGALGLLALGIWYYGHTRYAAGKNERIAYYEKTLTDINAKGVMAEIQARATEKAWEDRFENLGAEYVETQKRLRARADSAEQRYFDLLQERARDYAQRTSEAPGPAGGGDDTAAELERLRRYASLARGISERALHDASALRACQATLRAEREPVLAR